MKQKLYILGLVTTIIVFLGTLFKLNHWPGAGFLLLIGIFILVMIFIPLALWNSYKARGNADNRILYIVTWLTCFVVFVAMLFKIQHWAGAWFALIISLPFPFVVFLPVYLIVTGKNKNHNIYNTVYVLFLLAVISAFTALLALGVSKERIVDSLGLAGNYITVEKSLVFLPESRGKSPVIKEIDELLNTVEEYRNTYSGYFYDVRSNESNRGLEVLPTAGSMVITYNKIQKKEWAMRINVLTGLIDLVLLLEKTEGCEQIASAAPAIFNLRETPSGSFNWESDVLAYPMEPWFLIYLDGIRANLLTIRNTLP
jgi:hypothetical protein